MSPSSSPARTIPTRRMSFEESLQNLPKHFARDGDVVSCHVIAVLSALFPEGEDFFVRSVRNFRDQITDPVLKRQVAGFIGQEAMHGRAHRAFNERMNELGYPTKRIDRFVGRFLRLREKIMSPMSNLALTAALEHFTATLAELVMSDEEVRDMIGDEAVQKLFLWHALEESEHKAVAFDVYRAVGGSERLRIWTMNSITIGFILEVAVDVLTSALGDRASYRRGGFISSLRKVLSSSMVSRSLWRRLREYCRRDFHPDDIDNSELLEKWREELFGDEGSLRDLMVGTTAA